MERSVVKEDWDIDEYISKFVRGRSAPIFPRLARYAVT